MQAVILAGGQGKRLRPFTETAPKPMYPIQGEPFIKKLLQQIEGFEITKVILLLGYKSEILINYLNNMSDLRLDIKHQVTPTDYDTGARLKKAEPMLEDTFLLMYCDNYCPLEYEKAMKQFYTNDAKIQITAYSNRDEYTKSNLKYNNENKVTLYDKTRKFPELSGVDIGYAFVKKEVVSILPDENINFEEFLYPKLTAEGKLGVYVTEHRYYSIGSYERISLTEEFFREKKVVFLDRDGTINRKAPRGEYITSPEAFEWLDGAKEAIVELKKADWTVYLFTNQPGIARGKMNASDLKAIHEKMNKELEEAGGAIDGIYCCCHDWDEGCMCRKPNPGLLYQAQKEHQLWLAKCVVIGDDQRDMEAAARAGCQAYLVDETHSLQSIVKEILIK